MKAPLRRLLARLLLPYTFAAIAGVCYFFATQVIAPNPPGLHPRFPPGAVWYQDVSHARVDPRSSTILSWLSGAGGWGQERMQVDSSLRVLHADANAHRALFHRSPGSDQPDSDDVSAVPLPPGGGMEGQDGYWCPANRQDCHLLVFDEPNAKLYEAFKASSTGDDLTAKTLAVWDLDRLYPASGRGDQCASADAAGMPIAPLLLNADELAAGHIDHALRFVLPNARIRKGVFVHPATHAGNPSGPESAPPYGARFRLKADYDLSRLKPAARVLARALKKYGMFLAGGGNVALTAQSDEDTKSKYAAVGFGVSDLDSLKPADFEIVDGGDLIPLTGLCSRNR